LVEVFETDVGGVIEAAFNTKPADNIRRQLLHMAGALFDFYGKRPRLSLQIISEAFQSEGAASAKLKAQMNDFIEMITGLFREAQNRGELSPDTNCFDAALAFWSSYLMCLCMGLWNPKPNLKLQLEQLDRLLGQHLSGIKG